MYTTEFFKKQMLSKNPNIEILGKYLGDKVKIRCKCKICGNEWEDSPTHLKQGRSCSVCNKKLKQEQNKKKYLEKVKIVHNNKYDYSEINYTTQHEKIKIICPIHGEFFQQAQAHLRGEGCPKCTTYPFKKRTLKEFIDRANKIHNDKYDYTKSIYITSKDKIEIICPKHGTFWQTPDDHIQGKGCQKCQLKSQSKLFNELKQSFPKEEIIFEADNKIIEWIGLQRFDIYFPKYNIAVEYNGEQHYIPIEHFGGEIGLIRTKERDELKRKKCKENNCILFEIKYNYSDKDYQNLINNINKIINP